MSCENDTSKSRKRMACKQYSQGKNKSKWPTNKSESLLSLKQTIEVSLSIKLDGLMYLFSFPGIKCSKCSHAMQLWFCGLYFHHILYFSSHYPAVCIVLVDLPSVYIGSCSSSLSALSFPVEFALALLYVPWILASAVLTALPAYESDLRSAPF